MQPGSVAEIQELVRSHARLWVRGAGSKTALCPAPDTQGVIETGALSSILEYQPDEFTFTALAGTPLAEVQAALAKHGQFLPFDPPLAGRGATLGGTVASGVSGPGRYRYGGVRDFLIGVQFVDGCGGLVRGGGKVVKNAAGFDLPKLMVGSLGQLGILVELAFKVFPRPAAFATQSWRFDSLDLGLQALARLAASPIEIHALELEPGEDGAQLLVRLGGDERFFPERRARLEALLGQTASRIWQGEEARLNEEALLWERLNEFAWAPAGSRLVKVPLTPARVLALDAGLEASGALQRYSASANLAWIAWPGPLEALDTILVDLSLAGLVVMGPAGRPWIGARTGEGFLRRVRLALDPQGKFAE